MSTLPDRRRRKPRAALGPSGQPRIWPQSRSGSGPGRTVRATGLGLALLLLSSPAGAEPDAAPNTSPDGQTNSQPSTQAGSQPGSSQPGSSQPDSQPGTQPGLQVVPPGPPLAAPPALVADPGERRAIRGCPIDLECLGPALAGLREFELEAFGSPPSGPADDPWIARDSPYSAAANAARSSAPDRPALARWRSRKGLVTKPSELRPDLPWLDELTLPDLPVRWHERVIRYLEFYKNDPRGRNIMRGWLRRQGRYHDLIAARLRQAGLPADLLYVAMIESSYDPTTVSRAGASGLWQFMPAGGRIYGLWTDRWIDDRNDPVRSTDAVVTYFADLHQRFGDWHLALAAYNGGFGAVLRGVARYNTNDYWELIEYENALPWGTSMYVAKVLATAIVGNNRAVFGFDELDAAPAMTWSQVAVPTSVSLATVARAAGTNLEAIKALNPQLRRNRTPPTIKGYVIRVPAGAEGLFATRFAQLRGDWDRYDAYVVAHGQRFEDIATIHGISRRRLAQLNGIEHESEIRGGMVLVVPRVEKDEQRANRARARADLYRSGSPRGQDDELLVVAVPDPDMRVAGRKRVFYRVVTGDTLSGIAAAFAVTVADLATWNDLVPEAKLHPRMILQAHVPEDWAGKDPGGATVAVLDPDRLQVVKRGSEAHLEIMERRTGRKRMVYSPKGKPESFTDIGRKFGLAARDLARINRMPPNTVVEPGQEILVYQVVDRSRSGRADSQAKAKAKADRQRRKQARRRGQKSK